MGRKYKKIELVFPESEYSEFESKSAKSLLERFSVEVEEITEWFAGYQVDSIELHLDGGIETGDILKLFLNAKGEGGLKVTLKPRSRSRS